MRRAGSIEDRSGAAAPSGPGVCLAPWRTPAAMAYHAAV